MQTNRKLITVFVLALMAFMVSGSAASANAATIHQDHKLVRGVK
jgi:hypothetical protein